MSFDQNTIRDRIALVRAVSRENSAELECRDAQMSFEKAVLERVAEGLCVCHAIEPFPYVRFIVWNRRMTDITGYSLEEINRLGWYQTMYSDPEVQERAQARMASMREGEDLIGEEWKIVRKDGEQRTLRISTSLLGTEDGTVHVLGLMEDITERIWVEEGLRANEKRLKMAQRLGKVGSWEVDLQAQKGIWSDEFYRLLGYEVGEVEPSYSLVLQHVLPEDRKAVEKVYSEFLEKHAPVDVEFRYRDNHGRQGFFHTLINMEYDAEGRPLKVFGTFQDITERKGNEEELFRLATTDSLTSLFNRRHFLELAEREFQRSKRYGDELSLAMLDVDKFKMVNDTYGHNIGDFVLKSLAAIGLSVLRDVDVLGRLGGEEFAVLLPATSLEKAVIVAEKLRTSVVGIVVPVEGEELHVTVSLGVVSLRADTRSVDMMLKEADVALYRAKENGRNRVEVFG